MMLYEYCDINNSEVAPEVSNEFIIHFLDKRVHVGIERDDGIEYSRHFCHWLFINGYTASKLSLVA
jgi:hypothetical protein